MNRSVGRGALSLFLVLLLFALTAGCETAPTAPAPAPVAAQPPAPAVKTLPVEGVTLQCGDAIEIKFAYAPQFNESEIVRPDGKIELQLIGEVTAIGKTPGELRDELTKLYAVQLKHPELAVIVRALYERRVYVGGEVVKPGMIEMPGEMTALEAILNAGGFKKETAEVQNVIVVRNIDGRMVGQALDFKNALDGGEARQFYLKPRDIIYVPQTTIADVDLWMQQHIWRLLPPLGVGFTP